MSLIMKIDVPKHFAARRAMRLVAARPVSLPDATGFSEIDSAGTIKKASEFAEDFLLEHSSSNGPMTPKSEILDSDRGPLPA